MVNRMKNEDQTKEQLINLIAELKKTNEALRAEIIKHSRAEKELERFFNLSLDMFCITGLDGYIKKLNIVWERTLGFTGDELKSKPFVEFVHPEDRKATDAELQKLRTGADTIFFENRYLCRDGSYKWLVWTARSVVEENLLYAVARDVTERKRAEEELRKSEERFRQIAESAGEWIWEVDADGLYTYSSPAIEKILGYKPHEIVGKKHFYDFFAPDVREELKEAAFENFARKESFRGFVNPSVHKNGNIVILKTSGMPILDERGDLSGYRGADTDITERRRAKEALKNERDKAKKYLDIAGVALVVIDADQKVSLVNKKGCDILGYNENEIVGKNWFDTFIPQRIRDNIKAVFNKLMAGDIEPVEFYENPVLIRSGEERLIAWHNSVLRDETGRIIAVLGSGEDITERRQAEEQIREQASLLDKARDAIGVRDLEHRITYWNKGAEHMYGWTADEITGKKADELLYKEEPHILIEARKRVIEEGEWIGELEQVTKNGKKIIVESRWTLVHDSEGRPKSILVVNTDITEKKKIEAQFFRAQRMESIGTLASGIAHDLNNVLVPVMLTSQILREKFTDEQDQRLLNIIETNTQRGADLIKQVMSFARGVEGERMTLQVKHLIYEIKKIAKETFPRSIEIRTEAVKDLWTISGDATHLHQVLMNLCVNARDAMQDGGILSMSAENLFIDKNYARMNIDARVGNYIVITVSDTGDGISPGVMDRIFEPFFTTKEPDKGTGLGLSTVHAIVKGHGGFVNVYSEIGKGTTFKVYLPAITTTEELKEQVQRYEPPAGQGELVLVVDDEARICESTRRVLETHGYKAITANDGAEAVALYVQYREVIEVVLVDMMMPIMDGQACIRALRKINPGVRIIAVSGLTGNGGLIKAAGTTVHAFLSKPYTAEKLLRTIREVLSE